MYFMVVYGRVECVGLSELPLCGVAGCGLVSWGGVEMHMLCRYRFGGHVVHLVLVVWGLGGMGVSGMCCHGVVRGNTSGCGCGECWV